ncbi:MAG: zinc ribbon domain-containing protein [Thermoplasmata archaeon]|nr:zinc ribbon domain-containing protein [Thermoplasmata archaeon]
MVPEGATCPNCGAAVPTDAFLCPACHEPLGMDFAGPPPMEEDSPPPEEAEPAPPPRPASAPPKAVRPEPPPEEARPERVPPAPARRAAPPGPFSQDFARRLARLNQWAESVETLGVSIPRLPPWAEEAAREAPNPEPWAEVVRGVERIAQRRIVTAFEEWAKNTKGRLTRLEAYAVDSRLERDQIEDALHTARTGDIAQALATYRQVDRVVTIKERHLDQAREELERVVSLLKDMHALGIDPPQDPAETAETLEAELRAGKLAALKQQIRALRLQAVGRLKTNLPRYITEYGDYLVEERTHGIATELEAIDLARGARDFFRGRPEEGLRRLRALQEMHGAPPTRSSRALGRAAH